VKIKPPFAYVLQKEAFVYSYAKKAFYIRSFVLNLKPIREIEICINKRGCFA